MVVQLREVVLPSGRRFQFHYDNSSRLTTLVTPSHRQHHLQRLIMPAVDRLLYRPPHINDPYIVDYDADGRLLSVIHPQRRRRVTYEYRSDEREFDVFYDSSRVSHRCQSHAEYTLQTSTVDDSDISCSCVTQRTHNITVTSVRVTLTDNCTHHHHHQQQQQQQQQGGDDAPSVEALFTHRRDGRRRVISMDAVVAGVKLATIQRRYSDHTGQLLHASPFTCRRDATVSRHCHSDDGRLHLSRHYDAVSRLSNVLMSFNSHVVFNLQVDTLYSL